MNLWLGFTTSAVMGTSVAAQAFLADVVAQVWEVRILDKPRSPDDCWVCNCSRSLRFALVPGLLQGMIEGFVNGVLWDDYFLANTKWPSQYALATIINDCIVTFAIYPLSFVIHKQPTEGKLIPAAGAAMLLRVIIQLIHWYTKASFFLSDFLGSWLPLCVFSHMMYRHSEMSSSIEEQTNHQPSNDEVQSDANKEPAKVDAGNTPANLDTKEAVKVPEEAKKSEVQNAPKKVAKRGAADAPKEVEKKESGNVPKKVAKKEVGNAPKKAENKEAGNEPKKVVKKAAKSAPKKVEKKEDDNVPEKVVIKEAEGSPKEVEKADADKEQAPEAKEKP